MTNEPRSEGAWPRWVGWLIVAAIAALYLLAVLGLAACATPRPRCELYFEVCGELQEFYSVPGGDDE